jgi:hypothetical protein
VDSKFHPARATSGRCWNGTFSPQLWTFLKPAASTGQGDPRAADDPRYTCEAARPIGRSYAGGTVAECALESAPSQPPSRPSTPRRALAKRRRRPPSPRNGQGLGLSTPFRIPTNSIFNRLKIETKVNFARPFPKPEIALYPKQGEASGGKFMIAHHLVIWASENLAGHFDGRVGEHVTCRRTSTPFRASARALLEQGLRSYPTAI